MENLFSLIIFVLLLTGRKLYRRRLLHSLWMSLVIAADLGLIFYLVLAREALDKISVSMPMILIVHVTLAICTVGIYIFSLAIGIRLLCGYPHPGLMKKIDRLVVPMRALTLITSLWLYAQR